MYVKKQIYMPFPGTSIPAHTVMGVSINVQMPFHPERMFYDGPKETFLLLGFQVGTRIQGAGIGVIPMEHYYKSIISEKVVALLEDIQVRGRDAEEFAKLMHQVKTLVNNLGAIDIVQVGQRITLQVQNITTKVMDFHAVLFGTSLEMGG